MDTAVVRRRSDSRVLAAVLFTDIVDSSSLADQVGDRRWKELIARHHGIVRRELKHWGGRELDTAGDGFFASFKDPAAAVRCACAVADSVRDLGLEIRAGVHFGGCELIGDKLGGLTVVVGARVMALGGAGDVLITGTTRDLLAGDELGFADRGRHRLKGVSGEWQVLAVTEVEGAKRPGPAAADVASARLAGVLPDATPRTKARILVGVSVAVLVLLGLVLLWAGGGGGDRRLSRIPINSVGQIDPTSGEIEGALRLGVPPTAIALADDAAWVSSVETGILTRVGLSDSLRRPINTGGHPVAIAVEPSGGVWVLNYLEAEVVRIDPQTFEVIGERIQLKSGTKDLVIGHDAAWVTNAFDGTLTRIDLLTDERRTEPVDGIGELDGVAASGEWIWVAGSDAVARVDPGSFMVEERVTIGGPANALDAGEGVLWVTQRSNDRVARVDEATLRVTNFDVGDGPADVVVGGGAVWVTNSIDGTVSRIDPGTGQVQETRVGGSPDGVAFGRRVLWVAVHAL